MLTSLLRLQIQTVISNVLNLCRPSYFYKALVFNGTIGPVNLSIIIVSLSTLHESR